MNIWLSFVPGSAGSMVEGILRKCTDLKTINNDKVKFLDLEEDLAEAGAVTGHGFKKQWHPMSKEQLQNSQPLWISEDNIFTPRIPSAGWQGIEALTYIKETYNDTNMFYLGPDQLNEEFAAITFSKIDSKNYVDYLITESNENNWRRWSNSALDNWERREYLSLYWMQWWLPQMKDQWNTAKRLGFICYDTKYIFENFKQVVLDIIDNIGCKVTDQTTLNEMTNNWQQGQDFIWQKWENYVKYKDTICGTANHDVHLFNDVGLEAMIQYHLRERGIELKCYGLNTFPNSAEIERYYD